MPPTEAKSNPATTLLTTDNIRLGKESTKNQEALSTALGLA